jgi:anti-sigma factor RsiW
VNHETCAAQLDTYLDGELDSAAAQELDLHLRECSPCAAEAVRRVQWKKAVKTAGERYFGEARQSDLRQRLMSGQSRQHPKSGASVPASSGWSFLPARNWWPATAMALAALLLIVGFTLNQNKIREARNNQLLGELVDLHVATMASANPVDVVSTDRHTVKPWFAGKIPFSFDLPELQGTTFELLGGRVSYLEQSAGAELLFRVRKHQLSVFIFPEKAVPRDFKANGLIDARSFHLESFEKNGLRYFVIGDVATEDIQALARLFGM